MENKIPTTNEDLNENNTHKFGFTRLLDEIYSAEKPELAHTSEVWRSSGLGSCKRGALLGRLFSGEIPVAYDRRTLMVFEIGRIIEDAVIDKRFKSLDPNIWLVITEGEIYNEDVNLKGHFDMLLIHKPTQKAFLMECKTKNSRGFTYMLGNSKTKGEGANKLHKLQISSYKDTIERFGFSLDEKLPKEEAKKIRDYLMSYSDLSYRKTDRKETWSLPISYQAIFYISKDDMRIAEFPITETEIASLSKEWKDEVALLENSWNTKTAPPEETEDWKKKYCRYCEAGMCSSLDDEKLKELFNLMGK